MTTAFDAYEALATQVKIQQEALQQSKERLKRSQSDLYKQIKPLALAQAIKIEPAAKEEGQIVSVVRKGEHLMVSVGLYGEDDVQSWMDVAVEIPLEALNQSLGANENFAPTRRINKP